MAESPAVAGRITHGFQNLTIKEEISDNKTLLNMDTPLTNNFSSPCMMADCYNPNASMRTRPDNTHIYSENIFQPGKLIFKMNNCFIVQHSKV